MTQTKMTVEQAIETLREWADSYDYIHEDSVRTRFPREAVRVLADTLAERGAEVERLGTKADNLAFELGGLEAVRVKDNAYLIGERDAAVAERDKLRDALEDFATHGTRFDCNPTVMVYGENPQWMENHAWWVTRAGAMDKAVRDRARAALGSVAPAKERQG